MDHEALLRAVESEGSRFFDVADTVDTDRKVPACPEWTVEDLVRHLGGIQRWVAAVVEAGEPDSGMSPPQAPAGTDVRVWGREGFEAMLKAFRDKGPDAPCWNFRPGSPQTAGWWYRRQALEAAVHRHDIEAAAGIPARPVDPALAVEGVDEMLCDMLPALRQRGAADALHGTLHLHATDEDGEWWVDFDAEPVAAIREHKKAETALRGPASGLFLWLWNRQKISEDSFEVFGSEEILAAWGKVRI
ncbi:MAG TPA: maleylpyruvate isomerase family mycothiol-dependent enzyme [Acidimicrobiales bacterium]|nr:maleylpyruvate isomerase family mycothiol-dependent enzyme [Acidimicrobiales bacterium]